MIEEVLFFASVAWFAFKGFRTGVPRMLVGFGVLITCYLVTWLFSRDLASILSDDYNMGFVVAYTVAALATFFGSYFILSTAVSLITRISGRAGEVDASVRGAILGSVFGAFIGLFLAWAGGVLISSLAQKQGPGAVAAISQGAPGPIEKISTKAVSKVVETAIKAATPREDRQLAEVGAALISNPVEVADKINTLVANKGFNTLFSNPTILAALNRRDAKAISTHPDFRKLVQSPDVQQLARTLNMKPGDTIEEEFAESLVSAWSRIQAVRNTPRFQELMRDPEVRDVLASQNPMNIMANPKANELLKVILNPEGAANPALQEEINATMETLEEAAAEQEPASSLPVNTEYWRWRDENGQVHFSNTKPEGVEAELVEY